MGYPDKEYLIVATNYCRFNEVKVKSKSLILKSQFGAHIDSPSNQTPSIHIMFPKSKVSVCVGWIRVGIVIVM